VVGDSLHRRAAVRTGDNQVELNLRVLSRGFNKKNLRFWPLFNEGLWAILLKCIELSGYWDDHKWCPTWTVEFLLELRSGLSGLQEFEGSNLNQALPWKQGVWERHHIWLYTNCQRNMRHPVQRDIISPISFVESGRYDAESILCRNCYQFLVQWGKIARH
jgi:hypothetical protein